MNILVAVTFFATLDFIGAVDIPCAARAGAPGQGKICVCNSTYCDTMEQPVQLDKTQFHFYKTSNSSPGFTHCVLNFTQDLTREVNDDEFIFTINPSETFQEFLGFGGAITDTVGFLFNTLSPDTQDKLMRSYFGPSGIEYSLLRVPIGSTDFSLRQYTLAEFPNDEDLSHFSLSAEDYAYRIPMIKTAMSLTQRPIKITACTWNAPYWMKNQGTQFAGYIQNKYQALWAQYHIKFLEAYKENGLDVWSLGAGNEPALLYILPLVMGTLNCTLYTADGQARWLKEHLKPHLLASNFSQVKFFGLEDQSCFIFYWMDAFKIDLEARASLDGLGIHWYNDWNTPDIVYEIGADLLHKRNPDKMMLYTEGSINGGFGPGAVSLGSWFRAEGYIYRLMMILNNWNVGFMDWNLMLNPEGGPTMSFGIECPIIVNSTSDEFYKQPIFYALGHFSKFIQPGSVKVQVTSNQNNTGNLSVDRNSNFEDLVQPYAKITYGSQPPYPPVIMPQAVKSLAVANPDSSVSVIIMNTKNVTVPLRIEDARVGSIVLDIEEHSINSFIYWPPS